MRPRSALLGFALFLVPCLASSAAASPSSIDAIQSVAACGSWATLSPDLASFKRNRHAMAYDSVHDRLLIFGGSNSESPTYDGNVGSLSLAGATPAFSLIATTGTPPLGRQGPSMIYDASRDRIVIFGGKKSLDGSTAGPTVNEVWTLNLTGTPTWNQLTPAGTPPPDRYSHTAIYDVPRDRMIVFGGKSDALGELNDVWALSFSGTPTWTQVTPSGTAPVVRENHTAVYDGPRDRMVVFGGYDASLPTPQLNDTWALSLAGSGSWSQVIANGGPPPNRYGHTAVVDASHDRMLVFSGAGISGNLTDLWSLNLSNPIKWNQLSQSGNPPPAMVYSASVYDPVRTRMISFDQDYFFALTITNNSTSWAFLAATLPPQRAGASVIYDAPRQRLIMFGGATVTEYGTNDTWAYSLSGGGWSYLGGGPGGRQGHTAVFDPVGNRMIVYGGRASGVTLGDVWSLSLAGTPTWTQLSPTGTAPPTRFQHTAIFDAPRNRMVVYGGISEFTGLVNDVWALSLSGTLSWSQLNPTGGPPPARREHSAVFDSPRNRMLVFGGYVSDFGGSVLADPTVWALDLAGSPAWSPLPVGGGAAPMADHVAVYDPTRDAMLVAGQDLNSTQALNLSGSPSWGTLGLVAPPPPGRLGAGAAFDTGNDRWVVVSGYNGPYRNDVIALSFPSTPYSLDLQVSPSGSGNVQTNPSGKCFAPGTMVTLTAFAGLGYEFSNWSGDASGSTNPLTVTMSSNKSIIANFVGYPVNVTVSPTGSGTVSKSPNQTTYAPGTQVTLTANSSYPFLGWSGDASGSTNPLTITVDGPKNIMATFDAFTVATSVAPSGTGVVTKSPNQTFYASGSTVTLQANPSPGYQFVFWSGDTTGTANPRTLTVTGNRSVTANFSVAPPICGGWSLIPAANKPSGRAGAALTWDPVRHRMLVQGGYFSSSLFNGETFALSLGGTPTWTSIATNGPGTYGLNTFYDPVRDRLMAYGGVLSQGFPTDQLSALPLSGGGTWSVVTPAGTAPGARYGPAVIYDPLRDRMLLYGGNIRCGSTCLNPQNDLWQLTLAGTPTWTQIFPLGTLPPAGSMAGAFYDPVRDRMVVMNGCGPSAGTWAVNLSGTPTWTNLPTWGFPHSCGYHTMYDAVRDRVVAVNLNGSGKVSTLDFKLDPNQPVWSQVYPAGVNLGNRPSAGFGYDAEDDLVIAYGGETGNFYGYEDAFRLDFGGGFLLDAGGTNGSVTMSKWCYDSGEIATIVAQPDQGYKLNQWLGDASGNANPLQVTMDGFKVIRPEFVAAVTAVEEAPVAFSVGVHPNPSSGPARIEYSLPREARVRLTVFDIAGREVARVVDGFRPAGQHMASWGGSSEEGGRARAGIYLIRFETPAGSWVKRFALVR